MSGNASKVTMAVDFDGEVVARHDSNNATQRRQRRSSAAPAYPGGARASRAMSINDKELQAAREMFDRFDEDESGTMDLGEMAKIMEHLGYTLTTVDLTNIVRQVTDGDELEFMQFVAVLQLFKEAAQFKLLDAPSAMVRELSRALLVRRIPTDAILVGIWQCFMLFAGLFWWCMIIYAHVVPIGGRAAYFDSMASGIAVATLFTVMDIALNLVIVHDGTTHTAVSMHYVKRWLLFDLITVLPFEYFSTDGVVVTVLMHVKLWRMFTTALYFVKSDASSDRAKVVVYVYVVPLLQSIVYLVAITHLLTIVWFYVSADPAMSYRDALFFTAYSISGVGYGVLPVRTTAQRLVACGYCILAQGVNAFTVGSIVSFMSQSDITMQSHHQIVQSSRIADLSGVGDALRHDVIAFQHHIVSTSLADAFHDLVTSLPGELKQNITLFLKMRMLANNSILQLAHRSTQVAIARALTASVMMPGEAIYLSGEFVYDMSFVAHGLVEVVDTRGARVEVLKSGSHAGETALLLGVEEMVCTARCLVHCEIFTLSRRSYAMVCRKFPVFKAEMLKIGRALGDRIKEERVARAAHRPSVGQMSFVRNNGTSVDLSALSKTFKEPSRRSSVAAPESMEQRMEALTEIDDFGALTEEVDGDLDVVEPLGGGGGVAGAFMEPSCHGSDDENTDADGLVDDLCDDITRVEELIEVLRKRKGSHGSLRSTASPVVVGGTGSPLPTSAMRGSGRGGGMHARSISDLSHGASDDGAGEVANAPPSVSVSALGSGTALSASPIGSGRTRPLHS
jgi:hypothetical protein